MSETNITGRAAAKSGRAIDAHETAPAGVVPVEATPIAAPPKAAAYHKVTVSDGFKVWHVMCDADHSIDEVLHPSYLVNRMDQIEAGDQVWFRHELHEFTGLYYVAAHHERVRQLIMKPIIAMVRLEHVRGVKLDLDGAIVEYGGEDDRWRVRKGKEVFSRHHPKKEIAEEWLTAQKAR